MDVESGVLEDIPDFFALVEDATADGQFDVINMGFRDPSTNKSVFVSTLTSDITGQKEIEVLGDDGSRAYFTRGDEGCHHIIGVIPEGKYTELV